MTGKTNIMPPLLERLLAALTVDEQVEGTVEVPAGFVIRCCDPERDAAACSGPYEGTVAHRLARRLTDQLAGETPPFTVTVEPLFAVWQSKEGQG